MTSGTFAAPGLPPTLEVMSAVRRVDPDVWGGLAMLIVVVIVGGPTLVGMVDPAIPRVVWTAVFVVMLLAMIATAAIDRRRRSSRVALAVAALSVWVVVLGASGTGLTSILPMFVAALSVYVASMTVTVLIVVLNIAGLAVVSAWQSTTFAEAAVGTGVYSLIQIAAVVSSVVITREQRMRHRLTEAHVELQAASVLLAESARTAERLRISRDLHDAIGHQLTVLTLELEAARHRTGAQVQQHVERADAVARELLHDVRSTVSELRAEPADLASALDRLVQDVPGLHISVEVDPQVQVGEQEQVALLRAVQEVVTNTIRHADAHELWIEVRRESGGDVVLTAVDDGRGMAGALPGNGLRGMIERFEALGGEVRLDGTDGFRVTARVPAT